MKFREHRGSHERSMATTIEIEPTAAAIAKIIGAEEKDIVVTYYGHDKRNNWDTHIVRVNGYVGIYGYTDSKI